MTRDIRGISTGWCRKALGSWGEAVAVQSLSPPLRQGVHLLVFSGLTVIVSETFRG